MTVQAHNAKRPHYRASPQRELRSGRTYRASMLEALHPELYSEKYTNRPTTAIGRITQWLKANPGKVTISQIVIGSGCSESTVTHAIRLHRIKGLVSAGTKKGVKLWEFKEEEGEVG